MMTSAKSGMVLFTEPVAVNQPYPGVVTRVEYVGSEKDQRVNMMSDIAYMHRPWDWKRYNIYALRVNAIVSTARNSK